MASSSAAPPVLVRAVLFSCLTVVTTALPSRVAPRLDIASNSSITSPTPSLTTINVTPMQRNALFWTATAIAVLVSIIQGAITTLADICEAEGLWTIRFRLGLFEHLWWTGIATALATSLAAMIISFLAGNTGESLGILVLSTASSLAVFRYAWPAWRNRHYCRNRWMAWTGPSRTGIEGALVPYIGGPEQWKILNSTSRIARMHPVEKRVRHRANYIAADPTDLLKSAHASNGPHAPPLLPPKTTEKGFFPNGEEPPAAGTPLEKSSQDIRSSEPPPPPPNSALSLSEKEGRSGTSFRLPPDVYAPVAPGESASLLWGAHLGFAPRVSRGILSIPQRLLASNPRTEADHDGRAMCLTHGILARNKGLAPRTFILDITLNKLEEKSVQWPRPSKVLRSYYKKEFTSMYGGLGDAFVDTATELALLLADSHYNIVSDWLDAHLEHQDIRLNRQLYELGASSEDLQLLYRLSYAAMLVSLSSHVLGHHLRPEMSVFTTYVTRVQGKELPAWTNGVAVQARLVAERTSLTTDLDALIEAVLPPFQR